MRLHAPIIATLACAIPAVVAAQEPCDCSDAGVMSSEPAIAFWGEALSGPRGIPYNQKSYPTARFLVRRQFTGEPRRAHEVALYEPCLPAVEGGEAYFVYAWPRGQRNLVTHGCSGTRRAAGPMTLEDSLQPWTEIEHPAADFVARLLEGAAARCREEEGGRAPETLYLLVADNDDPVVFDLPPPEERCAVEVLVDAFRRIPGPGLVRLSGAVRYSSVLRVEVDALDCPVAATCAGYSDRIRARLLDVEMPMTEEQARLAAKYVPEVTEGDPSIAIARTLCTLDGIDAARSFAENNKLVGGARWEEELRGTIFECAMELGQFEEARALEMERTPLVERGVQWAAQTGRGFPLRKTQPSFVASLSKDQRDDLVLLRQEFLHEEGWEHDVYGLELFAETVAGDPTAPKRLAETAALAYHKAALLRPAAADRYLAWARELSPDASIAADLAVLAERAEASRAELEANASIQRRALEAAAVAAAQHAAATNNAAEPEPPPPQSATQTAAGSEPAPESEGFDVAGFSANVIMILGGVLGLIILARRR